MIGVLNRVVIWKSFEMNIIVYNIIMFKWGFKYFIIFIKFFG